MGERNHLSKKIVLGIICFIIIGLFQNYFDKICWWIARKSMLKFDFNIDDTELLMMHHFLMFLIVFIPTILLQTSKQIDFGYHFPIKKEILRCFVIITIYSLCESFIDFLFQIKYIWNEESLKYFAFQFFFSGTGEEILFRALPIAVFDQVFNNEKCKDRFIGNVDISLMLPAILFAIAHIPSHINEALYSQIYSFAVIFGAGIILGWIYRKSHSIWMSMLAHGLSNVLLYTFLLL